MSDEDLKKFDFGKYTIQELPSDSIIYEINYWSCNLVLILKNSIDISDQINFPENALHGIIFKVNQKVLDNLLKLK